MGKTTFSPEEFLQIRKNTALEILDVTLISIDESKIVLEMPITPLAHQPMGLFHGGMSLYLAETAASLHAVWGVDLDEKQPVGIEINGSHVNSARSGHVRVKALVIKRSRSLIVHQIDVIHRESEKLMCTGRVTNYYLPAKS